MGIFNTISEVSKNKGNFKRWEEQQRLEQAKREKIHEEAQYSEEEIEQARALGKTVIDAIDVMDNHSESVAENVETATEPLVFIAPFLGTALGGAGAFKFLINPAFKKQTALKEEYLKSKEVVELYEKISKGDPRFNRIRNLANKKKIEKIKDLELRTKAQELFKTYSQKTGRFKSSYIAGGAVILGSLLASFIGSIVGATKLQVNSSKIARYQAREELKDPKNFVNYTPEQIAQAKAEMQADAAKDKKGFFKRKSKEKSNLKQGFWGSLTGLIKDHKKYKNYKKNDSMESKIVTRELSQEEKIKAEKDKEVIQRVVRIVNNEAEKNSENMEVAADVLIGGTPILGALVGGGISWILNKTKVIDKAVKESIDKNSSKTTKEFLEKYETAIKNKKLKGVSGFIKKISLFGQYASSSIDDLHLNNSKPKVSDYIKRGGRIILTNAKGRNWAFGIIGSVVTGFAGLILGLKLQKSASRAGRYTAKRDLEKDPKNFIGYTEEEYAQVQNITPVKKESKFKEVALFIPRVLKQYFEYNNYKKHEMKESKKLKKYLHKQDVSAEQIKDAKNLQRKVFNTFEKVDDNSQIYSESMEAAIEIAQPFVVFGGYLAAITPFILAGVGIYKAKDNPAKIIEKVSGWMKNSSWITNNKLTKGYLNGVSKNVSNKVAEVDVAQKPLAYLLKDVNLQGEPALSSIQKIFKNLKLSPEELRNQPDEVIERTVSEAYYQISKLKIGDKKIVETLKIEELLNSIKRMKTSDKVDALDLILNPTKINKINDANFNRLVSALTNDMRKPKELLSVLIGKIPLNELKANLLHIKSNPELTNVIGNDTIDNLINILDNQKLADNLVDKTLSRENLALLVNGINKLANKLSILSPELKNSSAIKSLLKMEISIPEELALLMEKCKNNPLEYKNLLNRKNLNITNGGKRVSTKLDDIVSLPKTSLMNLKKNFVDNPSKIIADLKERVINSTPEDLAKVINTTPVLKNIKGLNKENLTKILSNFEKSINNIPKKELENIMNSIVTEFNKNPDEFVKLVSTGKLKSIFMTPELQKTLTALGIAIPTFTLIITYTIESWLADMQMKAGRLGVMKSLEDLDDIRYYANIEV